jgi:hypothetical protein
MLIDFIFGPYLFEQRLQARINELENNIMANFEALAAKVREQGDVVASAVALIGGLRGEILDLKAKLEKAGVDPAMVDSLVSELDSYGDKLAAAVAENTVAAPVEAPVEAPVYEAPAEVPAPVAEAPAEVPVEPAPEAPAGETY